jgi:hypothetical protein
MSAHDGARWPLRIWVDFRSNAAVNCRRVAEQVELGKKTADAGIDIS